MLSARHPCHRPSTPGCPARAEMDHFPADGATTALTGRWRCLPPPDPRPRTPTRCSRDRVARTPSDLRGVGRRPVQATLLWPSQPAAAQRCAARGAPRAQRPGGPRRADTPPRCRSCVVQTSPCDLPPVAMHRLRERKASASVCDSRRSRSSLREIQPSMSRRSPAGARLVRRRRDACDVGCSARPPAPRSARRQRTPISEGRCEVAPRDADLSLRRARPNSWPSARRRPPSPFVWRGLP